MKKDYVWNAIAGLINAAEAVIISIVVTRVTGLTDAGYFTIAFAVGNLLLSVGRYGVNSFQITDYNREYDYHDYIGARIVTVSVMMLAMLCYLLWGITLRSNPFDKSMIILFIGLIYAIEAVEDLLKAQSQFLGRFYLGSMLFSARWLSLLAVFTVVAIITRNSVYAIASGCAASLIVFLIGRSVIVRILKRDCGYPEISANGFDPGKTILLIRTCFPLFLYDFLAFYVSNSPKYALDKYSGPDVQACFGFVSMPVFVIRLVSGFIFKPQMTLLSEEYNTGKTEMFKKRIRRQFLIIAVLTLICLAGAYVIGIPVLSILYDTDLNDYKTELLIMLTAGGMLAVSSYQIELLTIMRKQKSIITGYIPTAIICFVLINPVTKAFKTTGAASFYMTAMILLCIYYAFMINRSIKCDQPSS